MWLKKILGIFVLFSGLVLIHSTVYAADYRTDYQVEYFLEQNNQQSLSSKVDFVIKITNLNPAIFVKKFSLFFPKSFEISNIKASDDKGSITPEVKQDEKNITLNLEFGSPNTGRGSENFFHLTFDQKNLFKVNGNIWEVILPTIENTTEGDYKVVVNLPKDTTKKISIAKPKPTFIRDNQIIWQNPSTKTIYAVFGTQQYYGLDLVYNLYNPTLKPVYTDVAFPPDTLYQKIFVRSIDPAPDSVFIDDDGNYMARYNLFPQQKKTVFFRGVADINTTYRPEMKEPIAALFTQQKRYLLSDQQYWRITNLEKIEPLHTPTEIYKYIVNTFQYDYNKLRSTPKRLGAQAVLTTNAGVCTEFTDFFIATAREKGIYAREIQGYGFSNDQILRPLSLTADVLHAWPEYYDTAQQLWVPLDPTWGNTSGIDYLDSFDLNHITFAIHGKQSDYPAPAGSYKLENSKDISVQALSDIPDELKKLTWNSFTLPTLINDSQTYEKKIQIKNEGNTFLWNIPLVFKSNTIIGSFNKATVIALAPYQTQEVILQFHAKEKNKKTVEPVSVQVMGKELYAGKMEVVPYYYDLGWKVASIGLSLCILFIVIKLLRKK